MTNLKTKVLLFGICHLCLFWILCFDICHLSFAQESDQQVSEFSLAGFGEKGKKTWDISGKSADIFNETVKLNDIIGNLYGEEEDIKLTADKGDFNKVDGSVHLKDNVVITTSKGARLTTETLDWDRKNQIVKTDDVVHITKENLVTTAYGAVGQPNLNQVTLQKDVQVDINPVVKEGLLPNEKDKTIITCDGPLQIDYQNNMATFNNNVKVERPDLNILSDIMDVYFLMSDNKSSSDESPTVMGSKIEKIICRGNVKIVQGENVSYSDEATYNALERKITLLGRPKLIIYSTEELSASVGN